MWGKWRQRSQREIAKFLVEVKLRACSEEDLGKNLLSSGSGEWGKPRLLQQGFQHLSSITGSEHLIQDLLLKRGWSWEKLL